MNSLHINNALRSLTESGRLGIGTTFIDLVSLAAAFVLMAGTAIRADVPRLIHYQGKLRDAGGAAVTDTVLLRFRLYSHSSNVSPVLFDESHAAVAVTDGLFNVLIGSSTLGGVPDTAIDAPEVWLGISVNDGDELSPRSRIGSGPHALKAQAAERLVRPNTFESAVTVDGSGNVGIGTATPGTGLEVAGQVKITGGSPAAGHVLTSDADGLASWEPSVAASQWIDVAGGIAYADGQVGVGTAAPSAALDVYAASGSLFRASAPGGASVYGAWQQHTSSAGWAGSRNSAIVFNDRLWVMGGFDGSILRNDVWYSTDGAVWAQATSAAAWSARYSAPGIGFAGRMWLTGGEAGGISFSNDVWTSTDGANWTQATGSAPWSRRVDHGIVDFGGRIWIMGGYDYAGGAYPVFRDVWYSTDGAAWTIATAAANWSGRGWPGSVVHNGQVWVIGGWGGVGPGNLNDVWSSSNVADWTLATSNPGWAARGAQTTAAYDGRLWVIAGSVSDGVNDVWYSTNGANWTQFTAAAPWYRRYYHSTTVYADKLWVLGGRYDYTYMSDVWSISASPGEASFTVSSMGAVAASTLATNGAVYSNGTVLTNVNPSSSEYKEDIHAACLDPERLFDLEPKCFRWKSNGQEDVGYIAEDVRAAVPELYRDDGRTKGYDAAKLPVYLLELVRSQRMELAEQRKMIESMRAELGELKQSSESSPEAPVGHHP